jgi:6-pyruvoyltetrahydropterin/6-carboxytetrahydropterin synthase
MIYLTKTVNFSSAHRLNSLKLSNAENIDIYSKCNSIHGHNYTVKVTVKGSINETTGMVINLTDLKRILMEITKEFDHKNIDEDVEFFRKVPSSAENICIYWWNQIKLKLQGFDCELHKVKIKETDTNSCTFMGE